MTRTTHRPTRIAARLAIAFTLAGGSLAASTLIHAESSHQPAIIAARAEGAFLRIEGFEFGAGKPLVTLGGVNVVVEASTATRVDALVPAGMVPGSYLLTLTAAKANKADDGSDASRYDEFWVTIGAVGPAGAKGDRGADGVPGPVGATGLAGPSGPQGPQGAQGPAGSPGKEGPAGPAGKDGAAGSPGKEGPQGPVGPAGPEGKAGAGLSTIQSLADLPCTVAACAGTTAVTFDPLTSGLRLSCVRISGNMTLFIEGSTSVKAKLPGKTDSLKFTTDVAGFEGEFDLGRTNVPLGFDVSQGGMCTGQLVSVTLTRTGGLVGAAGAILVNGGSCVAAILDASPFPGGTLAAPASLTCTFTMKANQTLTIQ